MLPKVYGLPRSAPVFDILPDFVYSYNHSTHRSIESKPALVSNKDENKIWHTLYDSVNDLYTVKYRCEIGDKAR